MDNIRLVLIAAISLVLYLLWQAWQEDYGAPLQSVAEQTAVEMTQQAAGVPSLPEASDMPQAATPGTQATAPIDSPVAAGPLSKGGRILVETDLYRAEIDTTGADLRVLELKQYPVDIGHPDAPLRLMQDTTPGLFVAQGGLLGRHEGLPTHKDRFEAASGSYVMAADAQSLEVALEWAGAGGLEVTRVYTFHRGDHVIDVGYRIRNQGEQGIKLRQYAQFQRTPPADAGKSNFVRTYTGGALSSPDNRYQKVDFDDMQEADIDVQTSNGWAAMLQHYFVGAWVPPVADTWQYYSKSLPGERYVLGLYGPAQDIGPGEERQVGLQLYAGPKTQSRLAALAPGLELTVDYGWLWMIAQPLFWLLKHLHGLLGNWGWSILALTLLIKLAFFQLSATSYKSMANMRRVQPKMVMIKERYGSDRQRMNQAMMELYKTEKINPLGGCLPILVQIPVFIALYWVLLESVELRQAPFMLWIKDLSIKDPYFVLPLLMGVTMFAQQKLNPAPMDPIQQKVMGMLPIIFTVFFAFFPAGLVLYWLANNLLSITQQWVITRRIEKAAKPG